MDKHRPISPQRKKRLAWTALVIFVLLTAAVCWFVGRPMLRFVSEPEKFRLWVDGHGLWGRVLYVGMCFLQVVVAIIPGEPLEIAGGYAFGAVWGTVLCLIGLFLGSVVIFALVRRFGQSVVEVFFPPEKLHSLRFLQSCTEAEPSVLDRVHRARYAEGSALLLRGADGSAVGDVAADVLARAASLSRVVDHRGRRARPAQLSVRGARLRGDDALSRSGASRFTGCSAAAMPVIRRNNAIM